MSEILKIDSFILQLCNGSRSIFWDAAMCCVSSTVTWSLLIVTILYIVAKNTSVRQLMILILFAVLLITLCDQISSSIIKPCFCRLRPTHEPSLLGVVQTVGGYTGGRYGFVSSHAANSFGMVTLFALIFRHRFFTAFMLLWAFVVSYSRVYLGVHYPGDILFGALLGVLLGVIVHRLYVVVSNRFCPSSREFMSSAYTTTGYLITDLYTFFLSYSITVLYIILRSIIVAQNL